MALRTPLRRSRACHLQCHLLQAFGRLSQGTAPPCRLWCRWQGPTCQCASLRGASRATGTASTHSAGARARAGAARISATPRAHSPRRRSVSRWNELRASLAAALRPLHNPSPRRRSVSGWTGVAHLPRRRRPARVRQPTIGTARLTSACTTAAATTTTTATQGETPCAPNTVSTLASTPNTVTLGSPKAATVVSAPLVSNCTHPMCVLNKQARGVCTSDQTPGARLLLTLRAAAVPQLTSTSTHPIAAHITNADSHFVTLGCAHRGRLLRLAGD